MSVRSSIGRFGIVPAAVIAAILDTGTHTTLALYCVLASHADRDETTAWKMSRAQLAEECGGVAPETISRHCAVLVGLGLLEITENRTTDGDRGWNSYLLYYTLTGSRSPSQGVVTEGSLGGDSTVTVVTDPTTDPTTDPPPPQSQNMPNSEPDQTERRRIVIEEECRRQRQAMNVAVRSEQGLKRSMLERIETDHGGEIDRILCEYPSAPYDVVAAAAIHGEKRSLVHYQRTPLDTATRHV